MTYAIVGAFMITSLCFWMYKWKKGNPSVERIAGNCPFCLTDKGIPTTDHSFRVCPNFRNPANLHLCTLSYCEAMLRESEELYFYAAGIIPYYEKNGEIQILLVEEHRHNKSLYNYIGGKRDCHKKGDTYRLETSVETMCSELVEEMSPLLENMDTLIDQVDCNLYRSKVLWWPQSKAAIYLVPIQEYLDRCIRKEDSIEAIAFKWFNLHTMNPDVLHYYVRPIIEEIKVHL